VPQSKDQPIFSSMIVSGSSGLIFPGGRPARADRMAFDGATFDRLRERHPLFDATNPDLSAFERRGGKLILFHGWSDPHISPINTIAYHEAVRRRMGARADGFERLYLMPGMYHCSGGEGPSRFDLLGAVIAWVEGGRGPDAIETRTQPAGGRGEFGLPGGMRGPRPGGAAGMSGPPPGTHRDMRPPAGMMAAPSAPVVQRSRPVYPYPYVAAYAGPGDPNVASSWTRGKASPVEVPAWAGTAFYESYAGVVR